MQFEHCLQTSRGHDRDVDVYLLMAIVLTKRRMLSRVGRPSKRRFSRANETVQER